jgi:hypothetical protein
MLAVFGYGAQAVMTGVGPWANLQAHLSDPVANNILVSTPTGGHGKTVRGIREIRPGPRGQRGLQPRPALRVRCSGASPPNVRPTPALPTAPQTNFTSALHN